MRIFLFCRIFRHNCKKMNIKTDSRANKIARLFLYPKLNAFTENTRKNHFFRMLYRELLRFIAFRHFRCSTVKIGSQREKLSLKTLIIPRVGLNFEFGSFFIYATILSFVVDFRDCDFNSQRYLLFPVLPRLCRKAKNKSEVNPNEKSSLFNQKS